MADVKRSRWHWVPIPTVRLAALCVLAALIVAVLPWASWPVVAAIAIIALVSLLDWIRTPSPRKVHIERDFPVSVPQKQVATLSWAVTNNAKRTLTLWFADELAPSMNARTRRFCVRVPAGATVHTETTIQPERRGLHEPTELVVRVGSPWLLVARQMPVRLPAAIKVFPPFDSRKQAELLIERARVLEAGLRSVRGRGGGTEFEQLREYTVDDDTRRIDWAATVRTGKPIVRTYRAEQNQNVVIMLDTGRVMAGQVNGIPRLEYAMDAVMALSTVATRLGDRVGMVGFADSIRSETAARHGSSQVARITDAMYRLEPELVESNYRNAFTHVLSRFRRRSLVVLFTELSAHAVSEALLPALPIITKRHMLVVASVTDPDVAMWARAVPEEPSKAFQKAAAIDALAQRDRTISMLRNRGVVVNDGVPSQLAASVVDSYLMSKATSRL